MTTTASSATPKDCLPPGRDREALATSEGSETHSFSWEALVPFLVHPLQVEIIEAMNWTGEPLSASTLKRVLGREGELPNLIYHVGALAKIEAIHLVKERRVRGAMEKFYFLR